METLALIIMRCARVVFVSKGCVEQTRLSLANRATTMTIANLDSVDSIATPIKRTRKKFAVAQRLGQLHFFLNFKAPTATELLPPAIHALEDKDSGCVKVSGATMVYAPHYKKLDNFAVLIINAHQGLGLSEPVE